MCDWSKIVAEHGPLVWQTAYRLLRDHQDAADCFQDTFLQALEASRSQEVNHWPGLLRTLATARALDRLRVRIRQRHRTVPEPPTPPLAGLDFDPVQQVQAAELAEHLREALAQLPDQQAEVFCLRFVESLSYVEIAQHLGIDANHVGVLLHRARESLRQKLAEPGGPGEPGEPGESGEPGEPGESGRPGGSQCPQSLIVEPVAPRCRHE